MCHPVQSESFDGDFYRLLLSAFGILILTMFLIYVFVKTCNDFKTGLYDCMIFLIMSNIKNDIIKINK